MKALVLICRKCKRMLDFELTGQKKKNGTIVETYEAPDKCPTCRGKVNEKTCDMVQAGKA